MSTAPDTTALAPASQGGQLQATDPSDILWDAVAFAHAQRIGKMFAESHLVPEHMRGKVADCTIALLMAKQLNESPLVVLQSIYVVSGKAGWSAQYIIARANKSGVFKGRINWRITGIGDALSVTAWAILAESGEEVAFEASMKMAKAEGWTKNAKYQSMPELMLRYRSATLLVRLYCPEVMLGMQTAEEVEDVDAAEVRRGPPAVRLPSIDVDAEPLTLAPADAPRAEPPKPATVADRFRGATAPAPTIPTPPAAAARAPRAEAPASQEGAAAAPVEGPVPADPQRDAECIRVGLQQAGGVAPQVLGQTRLKRDMRLQRLDGARWTAAIEYGTRAGWWVVEGEVLRVPPAPVAHEALIAGADLLEAIREAEEAIGDPEHCAHIAEGAGLPPEGWDDADRRAYLTALLDAAGV